MKTSPYCTQCQPSLKRLETCLSTDLRLAIEVELVGINAICHGAPNEGNIVEDHGWLIGVLEEDLLEYRTEYDEGEGSSHEREKDQNLR